MKIMVDSSVESVDMKGEKCVVKIKTPKGEVILETDIVLSAVGVSTNIEGIGLEEAGVRTEKGKVEVDEFYRTNVPGIFGLACLASKANPAVVVA
jgi:dihydrolipoamide dehydrogenase